jgi:hypothetical protein
MATASTGSESDTGVLSSVLAKFLRALDESQVRTFSLSEIVVFASFRPTQVQLSRLGGSKTCFGRSLELVWW